MRRLSLKTKIYGMVGALGAALLASMLLISFEAHERWRRTAALNESLTFSRKASNLIHQLQNERGKSTLALLKRISSAELETQRARTDAELHGLVSALDPSLLNPLGPVATRVSEAVAAVRRQVDAGVPSDDMTRSYGAVIHDLTSSQSRAAWISPIDGLESVIVGLAVLESAKEGIGQSRYFVSRLLAKNEALSTEEYSRFEALTTKIRSNLESPLLNLDQEQRLALEKTLSDSDWKEISSAFDEIRARHSEGRFKYDSQAFFERASSVMNGFFEIMNRETDRGSRRISILRDEARLVFLGTIFGGSVIFGLALMGVQWITRGLSSQLRKLGDRLQQGSQVTLQSATRLAGSAHALSDVSSTQAAALHETVSALEQIRSMIVLSAENAKSTSDLAERMSENATHGRKDMREMADSIQGIVAANEAFGERLTENNRRLEEILGLIREIGEKTKIINDIVFQTKLLSFNASVEAARAGEHGKGFAVVAEEIGSLASVSGGAASGINELLERSLRQVGSIISEMKIDTDEMLGDVRDRVERGRVNAAAAETSFEKIAASVTDVSASIAQISTAASEQSRGVDGISDALRKFDRTSQLSAASSRSSATAADSITGLAKGFRREAGELEVILSGRVHLGRFLWSDEYLLHVPEMDEEHKVLVLKMNTLAAALEKRSGRRSKDVEAAFSELASYTARHFADEEDYMRSMGYAGLEGHRRVHADLLAKVGSFSEKISRPDFDATELFEFLYDWLIRHILGADKKYAVQANEAAAKSTPS